MDWKIKLKREDDELVSIYESKFFDTEISILFIDSGDKLDSTQIALTNSIINNEHIWIENAISSITNFYKEAYPNYKTGWSSGDLSESEIEKYLPQKINREKLLKLITPSEIYIGSIDQCQNGIFGFGLECEWDIEHGLGLQFDNWKVNKVGGNEVAFEL